MNSGDEMLESTFLFWMLLLSASQSFASSCSSTTELGDSNLAIYSRGYFCRESLQGGSNVLNGVQILLSSMRSVCVIQGTNVSGSIFTMTGDELVLGERELLVLLTVQ